MEQELLEPSLEEELFGAPLPPLDLGAPPGLEELLRGLGPLRGGRGLSRETLRGLRQAGEGLRWRREAWLRWEGLERGLRELLRDPRGLPHTVLQELERALTLAELRLGGLPHCAPLPGPPAAPSPLAARVLPELERRLGEKVGELGSYYFGEPPARPGGGTLAQELEAQRLRLGRARARGRLLGDQLERLRGAYAQAVGRCGALLGGGPLWGAGGGGGPPPEEQRGLYLEAKGTALLLKARLEEVTLLRDTYPPPTLRAHGRIRLGLEEARRRAELEAGRLREEEKAVAALGPAFLALAQEYGRLRQLIGQRRWALRELHPPPD